MALCFAMTKPRPDCPSSNSHLEIPHRTNGPDCVRASGSHALYAGTQYLLRSNDGGFSWQEVSPDLTVKQEPEQKKPDMRRTVIYTIALSPVQSGVIWAGTGNGLIQVTEG